MLSARLIGASFMPRYRTIHGLQPKVSVKDPIDGCLSFLKGIVRGKKNRSRSTKKVRDLRATSTDPALPERPKTTPDSALASAMRQPQSSIDRCMAVSYSEP